MVKITLNLPTHRLFIGLAKRRGTSMESFKISRYFRHIFEHKNMRKILGTNLALILVASSFMPNDVFANAEAEENIIVEASVPLTTERSAQFPVEKVRITQGFRLFHPGIDLDGLTGDLIRPIKNGVVEEISSSKYAYGNAIVINHGSEITSLYAHLSKIFVQEGQEVTTNTVIGQMGATGRAYGDHLHLEIRDHGRAINPMTILPR